jgi:hypothetical protein
VYYENGSANLTTERAGQRQSFRLDRLGELAQVGPVPGSDVQFTDGKLVVAFNGFYADRVDLGAIFFRDPALGEAIGSQGDECTVSFSVFSETGFAGTAECVELRWDSGQASPFSASISFEARP